MKIIIDVDSGDYATIRFEASDEEAQNPVPLLHRAAEELAWQIRNYSRCPIHGEKP